MSVLKSLRQFALYNVVTPIAAFGVLVPSAMAADQTINTPETGGVQIDAGFGLTNNSSITNVPGDTAVWSPGDVTFLVNSATGTIVGDGSNAIGIDGLVDAFINSGGISNSDTGNDTVGFYAGVTSFLNNSGATIQNNNDGTYDGGAAVSINVDTGTGAVVQSFTNNGDIIGGEGSDLDHQGPTVIFHSDGGGDGVSSQVVSFINRGSITGVGTGVAFQSNDSASGGVAAFTNSGEITSSMREAVQSDGPVGTFTNSGTLSGAGYNALNFNGDVTAFVNEAGGVIQNTDASFVDPGNFGGGAINFNTDSVDGGTVGSFINRGQILAASNTDVNEGSDVVNFGRNGSNPANALGSFLNDTGGLISGPRTAVNFSGLVTSFTNKGTLTGGGYNVVNFNAGVTSFLNDTTGVIQNTNAMHTDGGYGGTAVAFQTDLVDGAAVDSFVNRGKIIAAPDQVDGHYQSTVGFFQNGNGAFGVNSFENSGEISGPGQGVSFDGGVDVFVNSGSIVATGTGQNAVASDGDVGSIWNSGLIQGEGSGFGIYANLGSFTNTGSGQIIGHYQGLYVDGSAPVAISNAGLIRGDDNGVGLQGGGTIINSGTIEATQYAAIWADGALDITNSGVIRGGSSGTAVSFSGADDSVTITTGSQIFGTLYFDSGSDTLDFAGFQGNTVLDVPGLDVVVPGARNYVWDQPNDQIAIFDIAGMDSGTIGQGLMGVTQSVQDLVGDQFGAGGTDELPVEPSNYTAVTPGTAAQQATETAVMTELDVTRHMGMKVWAGTIGGGSADGAPVDRSSLYAGIIAGSHARVNETLSLGGLGGYVQSSSSALNGTETLSTATGLVGFYGAAEMGIASIDFSLLGGYSGHTSNRKVVANNTIETAKGLFSSAFIAPSVGVSIPVLSGDMADLSLTGDASYVGGVTSGYTETGSSMNLKVGSQTIGVVDARVGLEAKHDVTGSGGQTATLVAKAGVFGQSNFGSASVPVTTLGQTISVATPGGSAFGVYAGGGIDAQLTDALDLRIHGDASIRTDGVVSASARASLGGTF